MSNEKTTLEIIAPTVEEAVEKGLDQLGLPKDAVDIEILDGGSKGLFGLGGRQARIRLTLRPASDEKPTVKSTPSATPEPEAAKSSTSSASRPAMVAPERQHELEVAQAVVEELLDKMRFRARIVTKFVDGVGDSDEPTIFIDIQGDDLSILIGRRSETLNALQYITSLIINKELGKWVPVMIDVQGYRSRRERQLRQIAHKMAEQAQNTGRRQVLEPMPPNERRIIHLELRDNPQVTTESIGEEPNRKVTISPRS